ncbi:hypothetical protein [Streptomyces sp. NBC_00158]|uniref:hypothetical protein n=1 Tax=Streptomyces sp. NBC_00158 TaxID=2903627 RepID=UPI002F90F85A
MSQAGDLVEVAWNPEFLRASYAIEATLRPGLGFGGGCLPKDLGGFITRADELEAGDAFGMLREAAAVNGRRRHRHRPQGPRQRPQGPPRTRLRR